MANKTYIQCVIPFDKKEIWKKTFKASDGNYYLKFTVEHDSETDFDFALNRYSYKGKERIGSGVLVESKTKHTPECPF